MHILMGSCDVIRIWQIWLVIVVVALVGPSMPICTAQSTSVQKNIQARSSECTHIVLAGVISGTNWDVLIVDPKQRQFINLTHSTEDEHHPAVSPDGSQIAFSARYNNNWDIYIMTLSDGSLEQLTDHPAYDGYPSWSPDGTQLIFESHRSGDLDLFLTSVGEGEVRALTTDPEADVEPVWLPDGTGVVFGSWRSGNRQLYQLDLDTQQTEILTAPGEEARQPILSPDGRYLAYVATQNTASHLRVRDMERADIMTISRRHVDWPYWSIESHGAPAPTIPTLMALQLAGGGSYTYPDGWSLVAYPLVDATTNEDLLHPIYRLTLPGVQWQRISCSLLEGLHDSMHWQPLSNVINNRTPVYQEGLVMLDDVEALQPRLSAEVVDSYQRLRQQTMDASGYDFLGQLYDAWRGLDHPDNTFISWHTAGRAIDVSDWYQQSGDRILYTARQDMGGQTYFRLYLRATRQDGSQGMPLRESLWETDRALAGSPSFDSSVRQMSPPGGYFIDFTDLAEREGWTRIAALTPPDGDWRTTYLDLEFWHYERRDQMTWYTAMQRIFSTTQLKERFNPTQVASQGYTVPQMIRAGIPGSNQVLMDGITCHYVDEDAQSSVLCKPRFLGGND